MLSSKWVINRIGLIDFWYYDDEEFQFKDGRLLLRGANGSGKSVTMQSFIPLLLDGNKAAERLDPFGTKARKLDNYLLEENDGRQERTGYLYMEFKRKESDSYITIGIGLCAKRNKKLDSWHFVIKDGRRVGRDFYLYKDLKNKITLSRIELMNRLGEGGQVIDGQGDYMKMVNATLFGYENVEEYKELVDLLIQLRTPKLSKDFKPTVLNEILSNSLPPLSDDDLRPMSEAIENMDNLKARLEGLEESKKAALKINEVYRQYNTQLLLEKATKCTEKHSQLIKTEKSAQEILQSIQVNKKNLELQRDRELTLKAEEETLKEKKQNLDRDDVSKLLEDKTAAEKKKVNFEDAKKEKEKLLAQKTEKEGELLRTQKQQQSDGDLLKDQVDLQLQEMEQCFEVLSFDEHEFMAEELRKQITQGYNFRPLKDQMAKIRKDIDNGIVVLEKKQKLEEELERNQVLVETLNQDRNQALKKQEVLEDQFRQVKEEWIEHYYQWSRHNTILIFSQEQERYLIQRMNSYSEQTDPFAGKEYVKEQRDIFSNQLQRQLLGLEHEMNLKQTAIKQKEEELKVWMNKLDPEPEREECITANRRWLKENNIPFYPFYKIIDFLPSVTNERRNQIEEALLAMGLLDAIILPSNYQKKVMESREGMKDKYIFGDVSYVEQSMRDLLEVTAELDDIVFYQELSQTLNSIGVLSKGQNWIDEEGRFSLGILKGTITKEYTAKFIGVRAREEFRKKKIKELEHELEELLKANELITIEFDNCQNKIDTLSEEYQNYPSEVDVKIAVNDLVQVRLGIAKLSEEIQKLQQKVEIVKSNLTTISLEIAENCKRLYLRPELTTYKVARGEAEEYASCIAQLELKHQAYLHKLETLTTTNLHLADIIADLEDLRYDVRQMVNNIAAITIQIASYEEQLELKDYVNIKEQLDACILRLGQIPEELKECYLLQASYHKDAEQGEKDYEKIVQEIGLYQLDCRLADAGFMDEWNLAYVPEVRDLYRENPVELAAGIHTALKADQNKTSSELFGVLQGKFHENISSLVDYNLTITSMFDRNRYQEYEVGTSEFDFKRIAIFGKYKGKEVSYLDLLDGILSDIDIQKNLVKESDRTLFEDILANTISKKIRQKIYKSEKWVEKMNQLMGSMNTSSGLKLNLVWKKKKAEEEGQLDTKELVELLRKDAALMREEELEQLSNHFQSKVQEARRIMEDMGNSKSFHSVMKDILDYRSWFEFQLFFQKTGENRKELTNNAFFTFSGGEKAMAMYVPLFSAVVAKYDGARQDAPRLVSLDEAFAGVDEHNIRDMFRLMVELDFEFIINSQILWGDCDTVPNLAIYQLLRKENAKFVTVLPYLWNGRVRRLVSDGDMESE